MGVPDTQTDERSLEFDRQMAELGAARASLSLSASEGDKKTTRKLEEVEKEIAVLEVARERTVLAEEESHRRAVEDERRKNEEERNEREARLSELAHRRLGIAEDIQSHVREVSTHVSALLEISGEMEIVALSLGRQGHYLQPHANVASYLNTSLAPLLPHDFSFPHSTRRGALVEMEESLLADVTDKNRKKVV